MQTPTDSALLGIWERGHGRNPVERALLVLAAALPESDGERLAALSIGERDATILRLLGMDHKRLTYLYQGRDMRLTDVKGDGEFTSKIVA